MGNNHESNDVNTLKKEMCRTSEKTSCVEFIDNPRNLVDYTNRRRMPKSAASHKSSEERRKENEEEFEFICLQLEEFTVSGISSRLKTKERKTNSSSASCSSSRHPEVEAFQRFLDEEGGHYGRWKEKDHLFFLKTRRKYPLEKTADIVNENFPDISVEKVLAHEAWYNEYLKLKAAKKRAIEEWKKTSKMSLKVDKEPTTENTQSEPEPKPLVKRDPNLKEKIDIWKAHCVAAKLERQKQQRNEELRKKREEEERKKAQEEKRALVNRYREDKLSLELAMKVARETEELEAKREAAIKAAALLKYFRYEDRRFTDRQRAKRQPRVKQEPRVKSAVEAKRDPNRLLQPTLGWIYHTKRTNEDNQVANTSTPLDLKHIPKLKKPAWRKGIMSP